MILANLVRIGDVFKVTSGGTPSRKRPEYFVGGTIPWVKTGDLKGRYVKEPEEFITEEALKNSSAKVFPKDTVLLAMYGATIGACSILPFEAATNQACGAILPSKRCHSTYLFYYLKSIKKLLIRRGVGGAQPNISGTIIKDTQIPLPPLPQQKKIAAILDTADAFRQDTKALIAKYEELAQSLFLEMFGDPVVNPMGFIRTTIGDQCTVKGGKRIPKGQQLIKEVTNFPYIKAGNIKSGKVTTDNLEYLTQELRTKLKRYIVNQGDVCITVVGVNIGEVGIVPLELNQANLTENANKLVIQNQELLLSSYLVFALQTNYIKEQIKKRTMAVGVPKLALFRIQQLELLLPPIELQHQFAERIQAIEAQKALAEESLAKADDLFNSLLQKAFKGELTSHAEITS